MTFQTRKGVSNFLFIITYFILPIFVIVSFALRIRRKTFINTALVILGGSSLLNALSVLIHIPIDRYLFSGYPLNLLICAIQMIYLIHILFSLKEGLKNIKIGLK